MRFGIAYHDAGLYLLHLLGCMHVQERKYYRSWCLSLILSFTRYSLGAGVWFLCRTRRVALISRKAVLVFGIRDADGLRFRTRWAACMR